MEFDFSWALFALPAVFAMGWFASRLDVRQLKLQNRRDPKAYFRGLNHLLNEQQDKAIDAFIEAVQNDPDTSELHFALGNLFRRRGDYDRAVRVHEHLLARGDLSKTDRQRAQHALALDFLRAGLLDRAEAALKLLHQTPHESDALLALLSIYERTRDWGQAAETAQRLDALGQASRTPASFKARQAHYLCEQAKALFKTEGAGAQVQALLAQAQDAAPDAARPMVELYRWLRSQNDNAAAWDSLERINARSPQALALVATDAVDCAHALGRVAALRTMLDNAYNQRPTLDVMQALVELDGDTEAARERYVQHLNKEPSLIAATRWMAHERLEHEQFHPQVQRALDHAVKPLLRYRCAACGFSASQHFWQCPGCQAWDSYPPLRAEEIA
jgi:lipopolysaccharide assembly protein B